MKRLKIIFVSILLVLFSIFNNVVFVYASNTGSENNGSSDLTGFDNWSLADKTSWIFINVPQILSSMAGLVLSPGSSDWRDLMEDIWLDVYISEDYASYQEFLAAKANYNPTTQTLSFDDDAMAFLNKVFASAKEEITYIDAYFAKSYNLPSGEFTNRNTYLMYQQLISNNPTYVFKLAYLSYGNKTITLADGTTKTLYTGKRIWAFPVPYAAVSASYNLNQFKGTLYNETWSDSITAIEILVADVANDAVMYYQLSDGLWYEMRSAHDAAELDITTITSSYNGTGFTTYLGNSQRSFNSGVTNTQMNQTFFTDFSGSIPCFKSVAAMKNGTSGGLQGQFMPGYTGQPITDNSITQTEINDFSTNYNYYYGSGSGGSGSGSGSGSDDSSGGWLNGLLSGLGKLGDIIMTLLSKIFDIITDILKFFTETLADALDIIPTGFVNFLGALFPFIPKEWTTAVSLMLAVMLIGTVIKIFRK